MTARKAAHSLQRAKGALASGFATVDLHHATGHDRVKIVTYDRIVRGLRSDTRFRTSSENETLSP